MQYGEEKMKRGPKKAKTIVHTQETTQAAPPIDKHAELQNEYTQTCMKVGDLTYRIEVMKIELASLNKKLFDLNKEALTLSKQNT